MPCSVALVCQRVLTLRWLLICAREERNCNRCGKKKTAGLNVAAERVDRNAVRRYVEIMVYTTTQDSFFIFRYAPFSLQYGRHITVSGFIVVTITIRSLILSYKQCGLENREEIYLSQLTLRKMQAKKNSAFII
jgi:hypothetical protein